MSGPIRIGSPALGYSTAHRVGGGLPLLAVVFSCVCLLGLLSGLPHQRQLPLPYPISKTYSIPAPPIATASYEFAGPFHAPLQSQFRAAVRARLHQLDEQLILSHDESLERQEWLCPNAPTRVDKDHYERNVGWWAQVDEAELRAMRARVADRIAAEFNWTTAPTPEDPVPDVIDQALPVWRERFGNGGRGIVYTAGNSDTISRLIVSLTLIRLEYNCSLPVEIFVFPEEMRLLRPDEKRRVDELGGVVWRTATVERTKKMGEKQFQIKGEAVVRSSFTEVLLLDSDNVPTRDPTFLFRSPVYLERGFVVWPDFAKQSPANAVWRTLGKDCDPHAWTAETGQLLISKLGQGGWNLVALHATLAMQIDHLSWFKLSNGDKDTFRYGAWFAGVDYTPAPHYLAAAGASVEETKTGHTFCGKAMVQHGLSSEEWQGLVVAPGYEVPSDHAPPLFVHANLLKEGEKWVPLKKFLGASLFGSLKSWSGFGFDFHQGNTFLQLKYVDPDRVSDPSRLLDSDLRYKVIGCRGVGTDVWDSRVDDLEGFGLAAGSEDGVGAGVGGGAVRVVDWDEAWGGVLRGFEDKFYDAMRRRR